jgi:hypothetical protein
VSSHNRFGNGGFLDFLDDASTKAGNLIAVYEEVTGSAFASGPLIE